MNGKRVPHHRFKQARLFESFEMNAIVLPVCVFSCGGDAPAGLELVPSCFRDTSCPQGEWRVSEAEAEAEAEDTFVDAVAAGALEGGDLGVAAEVADGAVGVELEIGNVGAGVAEVGRIGEVKGFGAELEPDALGDGEFAEEADIDVGEAGTIESIEAGGAEAGVGDGAEGEGVEVGKTTAGAAEDLNLILDLIGALGTADGVEGGAGGGDAEGGAGGSGPDGIQLPATGEPGEGTAAGEPALTLAEGELEVAIDDEVVGLIAIDDGAIEALVFGDLNGDKAVAVLAAAEANAFAPGIGSAELEAVGEAAVEGGLEAVVVGVANGPGEAGFGGASEAAGEDASGLSAVDGGIVEFDKAGLIDLARGDIACLADEAPAEIFLESEIPTLDIAALELAIEGVGGNRWGDIGDAIGDVRYGDIGDAGAQLSGGGEGVGGVDVEHDEHGEVGPHGAGEAVGVDGDAVASAHDEIV